jgi:hypothetical protein
MRTAALSWFHEVARPLTFAAFLFAASTTAATPRGASVLPLAFQGSSRVWVNLSSHVYHCPGTRYYGATKRGTFMTELDARAAGNRPAYGQICGSLPKESGTVLPLGSFPNSKSDAQVWVNASTGVYHCPGSRYYRNTKRGQLMSEHDAKASGNRPAYGKACVAVEVQPLHTN